MENSGRDDLASNTTSQIGALLQTFEENVKRRTADADNFPTMDELEQMLSGLVNNASLIFQDFLGALRSDLAEKKPDPEEQNRTGSEPDFAEEENPSGQF